jgi:uncharacterized protein
MKDNQKIIFEIFKKMYGEHTGHDYFHVLRVLNNARKIYLEEVKINRDIQWNVIELACLLHDIADNKFFKGTEDESLEYISRIMVNRKVAEDIKNEVLHIIKYMSFKGGKNETAELSIEGKIVRDADRLDAIGAIGIARVFATGSHFKRSIFNPENTIPKKFKNLEDAKIAAGTYEQNSINHFYEKLLLLKDLMLTKTGKKLSKARHKYMEDYLKQFLEEVKY